MFKTVLLCPAHKDCISKLSNNSIFKLIGGAEHWVPLQFLICHSSWVFSGFCLSPTELHCCIKPAVPCERESSARRVEARDRQEIVWGWLEGTRGNCSPPWSWLMQCLFSPCSVICGSGFTTYELKPISHDKGEKPSQGRKHVSLSLLIQPYTALCIPCRLLRGISHASGMISDSARSFSSLLASLLRRTSH